MSDTIELLNAIGQDASLRYGTDGELADALQLAGASEALRAAARGDRASLSNELGHRAAQVPQTQIPGHEEQDPEHEDGDTAPLPPVREPGTQPGSGDAASHR